MATEMAAAWSADNMHEKQPPAVQYNKYYC